MAHTYTSITPQEAAALVKNGSMVGFSGFTASGSPKAVPAALAQRARDERAAGREFKFKLLSGASCGKADEDLGAAEALSWRAPFQSAKSLRNAINAGKVAFMDMHLSDVAQKLEFGFLGEMDLAVVEATDITPDGRVYLTSGVGITPSILRVAKRVVIEINEAVSKRLYEMHDIARLLPPPHRSPIAILDPLDRIGTPFAVVDPKKVVGVLRTNQPDGNEPFSLPDAISTQIAGHVEAFLVAEMKAGRIPPQFLPLQAGVGNVSNAVMTALGQSQNIPAFSMYTEVLQDAQIALMRSGRLLGASTCSLTLSDAVMQEVYSDMDFFAPRIVLRPQELSNNPGVVRRLGVIAINTVLEMDLTGCANSTHVMGTQLMNGVGGSGDFTRNAYLSILMAPSTAKGGSISTVVPMTPHVDHNEHSIQILVTEQGLADLRGLGPTERAETIISKCAHPMYRDALRAYTRSCAPAHLRQNLETAFAWHLNLARTGKMLPT